MGDGSAHAGVSKENPVLVFRVLMEGTEGRTACKTSKNPCVFLTREA